MGFSRRREELLLIVKQTIFPRSAIWSILPPKSNLLHLFPNFFIHHRFLFHLCLKRVSKIFHLIFKRNSIVYLIRYSYVATWSKYVIMLFKLCKSCWFTKSFDVFILSLRFSSRMIGVYDLTHIFLRQITMRTIFHISQLWCIDKQNFIISTRSSSSQKPDTRGYSCIIK